MEIFKTDDGKVIVVVSRAESKETATKMANRHFKAKKNSLVIKPGYKSGDYVYDRQPNGKFCSNVWLIKRK